MNSKTAYNPVPYLTVDGDVIKIDPENLKKFLMSEKGMLPAYPQTRAILEKKKPILQQWVAALCDRYKAVLVNDMAPSLIRLAQQQTIHRMATVPVAISGSDFWSLVDKIGWGTKTTDYKMVKRSLMRVFTPAQCEGILDKESELRHQLTVKFDKYLEANGVELSLGDDGFSDLMNHIVGLGKSIYNACMKNPDLIVDLARRDDFAESFSYCFPHADDFDSLNVSKFINWAVGEIEGLKEAYGEPRYKSLWPEVKLLIENLKIMARGDWFEFLETETEGRKLAESLSKKSVLIRQSAGAGPQFSDENRALSNKWAVWNLYSDVREYLDASGPVLKLASEVVFRTDQFSYSSAERQFTAEASELRLDGWPPRITLISQKTGSRVVFIQSRVSRDREGDVLFVEYANKDPMVNCTIRILND
jgi:hypothetical protein